MKVWLLFKVIPYESTDVVGVYSSREKAEEVKARLEPVEWAADFDIEEHEVDADANS